MFGNKPKIIDLNIINRIIEKQEISKINDKLIRPQKSKDETNNTNNKDIKEDILWL